MPFANKVGSLQVVLGWNSQTRSDYLFVVSTLLMKIRLMMARKTGHAGGPGLEVRDKHTI